jgi:hypothetical protein
MPPVRITFKSDSAEVVLQAYECLRGIGIKPIGFVLGTVPRMILAPQVRKRALDALSAAGFNFSEV